MAYLASGPLDAFVSVLALSAAIYVSFCMGSLLLLWLGPRDNRITKSEWIVFAVAIGLLLWSLWILGVGSLGRLDHMYLLFPVISVLIWPMLRSHHAHAPGKWDLWDGIRWFYASLYARPFLAGAALLLLGLSLISALAPAIGNDALTYHLEHPKQFLERGRIELIAGSRESLWPYLSEMLFTLGLAVHGISLAKLLHWVAYPMLGWAVYLAGIRFFNPFVARMAALAFLSTPVAFAQSGYAYVDLMLALYVFLVVYVLALVTMQADSRMVGIAGILGGGALAVKMLGLGVIAAACAVMIFPMRLKLRPIIGFVAAALLAGGIWYLRSWIFTGNPVYPFFAEIFGGPGEVANIRDRLGVGKDLGSLLWFGWNITLHPDLFGRKICEYLQVVLAFD